MSSDLITQHGPDCDPVTLVGMWELGRLFGVSSAAVGNWARRYPDFPEPVVRLKMGPVFIEENVVEWYESRLVHEGGESV